MGKKASLRRYVKLKPLDRVHSQVVVEISGNGKGGPPAGYIEVPANVPDSRVGTTFRNGFQFSAPIMIRNDAVAVAGFEGLGDTVYMRGPLKKLVEREKTVYLTTPWPQLFWDMPGVKPVRPDTILRTQAENTNRVDPSIWHQEPPGLRWYEYKYDNDRLARGQTPITAFMEQLCVSDPIDFSMAVNPAWISKWMLELPRPIGIVHPPVVRSEWTNTSRNPKMEYLQDVVSSRKDIYWISVGWEKPGQEWLDGPPLGGVQKRFDHGELQITEVIALVKLASLVLCGPSFPLPMSAAIGTPVLCLFGGSLPPRCLVDPRMGAHVGYVAPQPFCACFSAGHACNKNLDKNNVIGEIQRLLSV